MHNTKFFSYLSLNTFMLIIIITANNLLLILVGTLGAVFCSHLILSCLYTRIPVNKSPIHHLSQNIMQKYPKVTAVLISSAIATLVGISSRIFFLWYLDLDILNFPLHPILCSINLFSINSIRSAIKLLIKEWLLPSNVLMMNSSGDGSPSSSSPSRGSPDTTGSITPGRVSPSSRSPSPTGGEISRSPSPDSIVVRPNPFGLWDRQIERDILRGSYQIYDQWRESNPNGNAIHNPNTLRERLLAYRARANIHSRGLPIDDPTNTSDLNYVRQYNSFLANNNPPFLNENVPL